MKRILFLLCPALLLSSCLEEMDPYEGGDGVRANINGSKCVMVGIPGKTAGAFYTSGNDYSFQTAVIAMSRAAGGQTVHFQISVSDEAPLETGKRYSVGSGGNTAVISYVSDDVTGSDIKLKGWVSFLKVGPGSSATEARFELAGRSPHREYDVRHGFLRLRTENGERP